jgi:hypothetical protein
LRSRLADQRGRSTGKAVFQRWDGTIRETLAAFEDLRDATCPDDREFGGSVLSNPLYPTQKTARSGRMDIDIIGATISQSTTQKPLDIGAVAYVA